MKNNEMIYELLDHIGRLKENTESYGLFKTKRDLHFVKFELEIIAKMVSELEKQHNSNDK